jgi:membrane-bound serine protease (ClpP class)
VMPRLVRLSALLIVLASDSAAAKTATVISIADAIGPATADFVQRGLARAAAEDAELVVLELDTPGGLDTSMRVIVKEILSSPVPVVVFVAPSGARAASAGTYVLYASHLAAMAPATNLGAATPVEMGAPRAPEEDEERRDDGAQPEKTAGDASDEPVRGDAMTRKQVNDAAAYLRGLAQSRGRNAEWAERAVREAVSLSAEEALAQGVVEVVATDVPDLLKQLDGRKVKTMAGERPLETTELVVERLEPDWRTRVLAAITNPSIAYILMLVGIYGILFEFYSPGFVLPGVVGAICLVVALFGLHLLPVSYAGLALILLGIAFMVAEGFLPSFGALGIGGIAALAIGSVMLIDTEVPGFGVPPALIASVTGAAAVLVFALLALALEARRRPVVSGRETMIGAIGEVLGDCPGEGWARVQGETWRVRSAVPLKQGQRVRITAMDGLVLSVSVE